MTTTSEFLRHLRTVAARQAHAALSDQQLLERFLHERSEASFAALVQRHGPMVLSVCRRVLRHAQDAEDAFQATFLILARKAGSIRQRESLSSWLHGVAYHRAECLRDKARRRAAHERRVDPLPPGDAVDDITWRELRAVLDEELQRLPERYRAPLVLCYLEARTQDEAARHLGWSKNTFGRRMNQARQRLAQRLISRGITLSAALTAPLLLEGAAQSALPPLLAANTIRAGLAAAMGNTTGGIVSAQVLALTEGGVGSLLAKKASLAVVLLGALMLGVSGLLAHRTVQDRTRADAPAAPPPARSASKDKAIEITGRVLDPDGKPFAGARLFLLPSGNPKKADKPACAATDREGRFRFSARPADFGPQGKAVLAATAKGFGLDWTDVNESSVCEEITLRLALDDKPITGRVLDLEGRPIAGATVQVRSVDRRSDGKDLAAFVETVQKYLKNPKSEFQGPLDTALSEFQWKRLVPTGIDVPATVTTDADGRFRLTGFGRERVLWLVIRGPSIGHAPLYALTRDGPAKGWIPGNWGLYGSRFEWLAVPGKPIVGTVRDKRTGKPIAGITVSAPQALWIRTKTDSQGRYRILGAAKSKEYDVIAGEMPYFNSSHRVADTPGLEPITVDFQLERGIIVRGRLTEKTTGKPVRGEIDYGALAENQQLKDFAPLTGRGYAATETGKTAADGSFALAVLPGPGLLLVTADDVNRFAAAEDKGWQTTPRFPLPHAVVAINPSEKDSKSTTCEIVLEPARILKGSVLGPEGRPLDGAYAAGCWPIIHPELFTHEKLGLHSFTVGGVKTGRPRMLAFYHREKRLGKVLTLRGDETKPLEVRLEPLGSIAGRILDAKGRPWSGLRVRMALDWKGQTYPPEFGWVPSAWFKLTKFETKTDRDGKFRFEGLLPGLKYEWTAAEGVVPSELAPYHADDLTVESGKTKDLGDLKSKRVPE